MVCEACLSRDFQRPKSSQDFMPSTGRSLACSSHPVLGTGIHKLRNSMRLGDSPFGETVSQKTRCGPSPLWGCQSRRPQRIAPKTACPTSCRRRASHAKFFIEVASKEFLLHRASTTRRAWKQLPDAPDKTGANNVLAGAPEELRTPGPRFEVCRFSR